MTTGINAREITIKIKRIASFLRVDSEAGMQSILYLLQTASPIRPA
jgi:hypothetical protein